METFIVAALNVDVAGKDWDALSFQYRGTQEWSSWKAR
jgi:hypothetical protein